VEELPFDCAAFEHLALRPVELVESCREQRAQRRRHLCVLAEGNHLGEEERIASGGADDPLANLVGHGVANERAGLVIRQRLEPQQGRPARAAIEQLRPRHAQK
jgi:hypothetical protein